MTSAAFLPISSSKAWLNRVIRNAGFQTMIGAFAVLDQVLRVLACLPEFMLHGRQIVDALVQFLLGCRQFLVE